MKLRLVRITWLLMAAAFIGTGINAVAREGLVVAAVLGAAAVGLIAAVLLPGVIAGRSAASHSKRTAADKPALARIAAEVEAAEARRLEQAR